jgi:hypothetical protein
MIISLCEIQVGVSLGGHVRFVNKNPDLALITSHDHIIR